MSKHGCPDPIDPADPPGADPPGRSDDYADADPWSEGPYPWVRVVRSDLRRAGLRPLLVNWIASQLHTTELEMLGIPNPGVAYEGTPPVVLAWVFGRRMLTIAVFRVGHITYECRNDGNVVDAGRVFAGHAVVMRRVLLWLKTGEPR